MRKTRINDSASQKSFVYVQAGFRLLELAAVSPTLRFQVADTLALADEDFATIRGNFALLMAQ